MRLAPSLARLALLLLLTCLLLIGGMRLLPMSHADLSEFDLLFSNSTLCDSPCLMGIPPGILLTQAADLLEAHPWVDSVRLYHRSEVQSSASWTWNGSQPDFIDARDPGVVSARSYLGSDVRPYVSNVQIATTLPLQQVHARLGPTAAGSVQYLPNHTLVYEISYYDSAALYHTRIETAADCPAWLMHFYWLGSTRISHYDGLPRPHYTAPNDLVHICRDRRVSR